MIIFHLYYKSKKKIVFLEECNIFIHFVSSSNQHLAKYLSFKTFKKIPVTIIIILLSNRMFIFYIVFFN